MANQEHDAAKFGALLGLGVGLAACILTFHMDLNPANAQDLFIIVPVMGVVISGALLIHFKPWRKRS